MMMSKLTEKYNVYFKFIFTHIIYIIFENSLYVYLLCFVSIIVDNFAKSNTVSD